MGRSFLDADVEVVIADVLTPDTIAIYRRQLPGCVVVHLRLPLEEARRRAASRRVWLTDQEFTALHHADAAAELTSDHALDVRDLGVEEQVAAVERLWGSSSSGLVGGGV